MSLVIFFFGSGLAFFAGALLLLAAAGAFSVWKRAWQRSFALLAAITGLLFIVLSATPLPYWCYGIAIGVTVIWLVFEELKRERFRRLQLGLRALVAILWLAGIAMELPYQFTPTLVKAPGDFFIIGDSVSAGLGERSELTWPRMLAEKYPVPVHDFSHVGAKASSAIKQAKRLPAEGGIVLLEIGGNDVLGGTPAAKFEQDLDGLLKQVCRPGREVVMFELPLPPLHNEFGRIQRCLASQYDVRLIPKRVFVSVLTAGGATLDSVHLSEAGHERMAEVVWGLLRPAYIESSRSPTAPR